MRAGQVAAMAAAAAVGVWLGRRYQRHKRAAENRLRAGSQIIETTCGPVEYAAVGEGSPLLFAHGALGGYDQSLLLARLIHGFTVIAPSRPGHLRTPLSTGRSPARQADAYAALLDALHISRVAIIGGSGGGPSALRFAAQYPDRCWALVLVSAICLAPPASTLRRYWFWAALSPFDFGMWLFTHLAFDALLASDRITPDMRRRLERDTETMDILRGLLQNHPTSGRTAGLVNDLLQTRTVLPLEGLERISAPTLVIHGRRDPIVPFENGEHIARTVPGAALLAVEGGGHTCIATHRATTIPTLEEFLRQHAPNS